MHVLYYYFGQLVNLMIDMEELIAIIVVIGMVYIISPINDQNEKI